jgi:hypothetical protein
LHQTGLKYSFEYANNIKSGIFGTTAYSSVLLCLIIPSIILKISNTTTKLINRIQYCFIFSFLITLFFYLSARFAIALTLLQFFLHFVSSSSLKLKLQNLFVILIFSILLLTILNSINNAINVDDKYNLQETFDKTFYLIDQDNFFKIRDLDRLVLNYVPIYHAINNFDFFNLIFGTGLRTSSQVIYQTQYELLNLFGINAVLNKNPGTTAFSAIFIETGLVGCILLFSLSIISFYSLIKQKYKIYFCFLPLFFMMQIFIINSFDMIIFYILLIPNFIEKIFQKN